MVGIISKLLRVAVPCQKPAPPQINRILQLFEVGAVISTAGPGHAWKIYDAIRKSDKWDCSVFIIEKSMANKIYRPTKKKGVREVMLDCIREGVLMLQEVRHPMMVQVLHPLEECANTYAFATEAILASLHDILAWQESHPRPDGGPAPVMPLPTCHSPMTAEGDEKEILPPTVKNYWFLDIEVQYGMLQILEALNYLHYTAKRVHRNVSPQSILVCKKGTWKLFGLDFLEPIVGHEPTDMISVPSYNIKLSRVAQPDLDYMAPEMQIFGQCNILSDMYSLGMVVFQVYNQGQPLIRTGNNPMSYLRQIENLDAQIQMVGQRVPGDLREVLARLLCRHCDTRPTTLLFPLVTFFKNQWAPAIAALQFLDAAGTKEVEQRTVFYTETLMESIHLIPEKLIWIHVWPALKIEVRLGVVVDAVFSPIIWLMDHTSYEQFEQIILPLFKELVDRPRTEPASVAFLTHLHRILRKCRRKEAVLEILPIVNVGLDNVTRNLEQAAALMALLKCMEHVDDELLLNVILEKVKKTMEHNSNDVKIANLVLCLYEEILIKLEEKHVVELAIPTLLAMRLTDPETIIRVVKFYKTMIADSKYGLNSNLMAERILPMLAPLAVNTGLTVERYYELIDSRVLRHRQSFESMVEAPPFSIPNLRVERERKTSSADDMARKASVSAAAVEPTPSQSSIGAGIMKFGQWVFGSNNSTNSNNNENNFLRVASNVFPKRRLSDNTLLNPRGPSTSAAPSCSSSPGGAATGSAGLPTRRHSSIGPQERRGSHLSPPTAHQTRGRGGSGSSLSVPPTAQPVGGSMPNTSTSAPYLGASNASVVSGPGSRRQSGSASRRPSACPSNASHLSSRASHASPQSNASGGMLHQLHSGVVRKLPQVPPRIIRTPPRDDDSTSASPGTSIGATPGVSIGTTSSATPTASTSASPRATSSATPSSSRSNTSPSGSSHSSVVHNVTEHVAAPIRSTSYPSPRWLKRAVTVGNRALNSTVDKCPAVLKNNFKR